MLPHLRLIADLEPIVQAFYRAVADGDDDAILNLYFWDSDNMSALASQEEMGKARRHKLQQRRALSLEQPHEFLSKFTDAEIFAAYMLHLTAPLKQQIDVWGGLREVEILEVKQWWICVFPDEMPREAYFLLMDTCPHGHAPRLRTSIRVKLGFNNGHWDESSNIFVIQAGNDSAGYRWKFQFGNPPAVGVNAMDRMARAYHRAIVAGDHKEAASLSHGGLIFRDRSREFSADRLVRLGPISRVMRNQAEANGGIESIDIDTSNVVFGTEAIMNWRSKERLALVAKGVTATYRYQNGESHPAGSLDFVFHHKDGIWVIQ